MMEPRKAIQLLALLTLQAGFVQGEIIPAANAPKEVWKAAGVPGGIPHRTKIYKTLAPGITTYDLQTAIDLCPKDEVILLEEGTYNLGAINLGRPARSHWTLRGEGMGKTILNLKDDRASFTMGGYPPWDGKWENSKPILKGGKQGSTRITVDFGTFFYINDHAVIDMANADWIQGEGSGGANNDSAGKERDGERVQLHTVQITDVDRKKHEIEFWPPLPFDLDPARDPQISRASEGRNGPVMAGIEDLTLHCGGSGAGIQIQSAHGFWLKNVEVRNWGTFGVWPRWTSCFEMRGCYVHDPAIFDWSRGYGLQMDPVSGGLIVDNIFYKCQDVLLLQGGCAGNVLAYNVVGFSYNNYIGPEWLIQEMAINHSPFPAFNLFEGNYTGKIQADYYFGPSGWGTIFRNRVTGNGPWTKENRIAISLDARQRHYSVVGNQLGEKSAPPNVFLAKPDVTLDFVEPGPIPWLYDPGSSHFDIGTPHIYRLGYPNSGNNGADDSGLGVHDDVVKTQTLRHGNWDAATNSVVWDPAIADRELPESLFLDGKPEWFGDLEWPPYGPSEPAGLSSDLSKIPAGYRLLYNQDVPSNQGKP